MGKKFDIVSVFLELKLDHEKLIRELDKLNLSSPHLKTDKK